MVSQMKGVHGSVEAVSSSQAVDAEAGVQRVSWWRAMGIFTLILTSAAIVFAVSSHLIKEPETLGSVLSLSTKYSNEDSWNYTFYSTVGTPLGIFSSSSGKYVISSDSKGHVYRSTDYGGSWKKSRPFLSSKGKYASIYGLVMTGDGSRMIAGTGKHHNYLSTDFGKSWKEMSSSQSCSVIAGSSTLNELACVGGFAGAPPEEETHIMVSTDGGQSWNEASDKGLWIGVVSSTDFSLLAAVKYTGSPYFYISEDYGTSFTNVSYFESSKLSWSSLCADEAASQIVISDHKTRNVHMSDNLGKVWFQIFSAKKNKVQDDDKITACAVSRDGNLFALGWSGHPTTTVFDCPDPTSENNCNGEWSNSYDSSSSGSFDTPGGGLAVSANGKYLFLTNARTNQIATGKIDA
jgi:photosystem II stability/assembly factor-like uncharacterized protein